MGQSEMKPPVPLFALFTRMGGWLVIVGLAITLLLSLIGQGNQGLAERFEADGFEARAVVIERQARARRDADRGEVVDHALVLAFDTREGKAMRVTQDVSKAEHDRVAVGDEIDLRYLGDEPRRVELIPGQYGQSARDLQGVALAAGFASLAGLWLVGGWTVSAVRARRHGARQEALVKELRRSRLRFNSRERYRLIWVDGQGHEGRSLLHRYGDLQAFRAGDRIGIYQGVKRSWWVGDVGERGEATD